MVIGKLLDAKGHTVATIAPGATVRAALAALAERGIGALVVSADGRRPAGIVSERDVVRRLHDSGAGILERPVAEIMVGDVRSARPGDDVESVMALMTVQRIRHVPVLDDGGELVGIVSIGDVVKSRLDALEDEKRALVDYIYAR